MESTVSYPTSTQQLRRNAGRDLLPWIVFASAVGIILLFWAVLPERYGVNESSDYAGFYEPMAHRILDGRGFVFEDGELATRYPPGYPIVLAGVFGFASLTGLPESVAVSGFTLFCGGLSALILFGFVRQVFSPWAGLVAAALWTTYPLNLWMTKQPNSELPFTVCLFATWWLFWKALQDQGRLWLWCLIGILTGLCMLQRPIAIGLGVAFTGIVLLAGLVERRRSPWTGWLAPGALMLASAFLTILPWEAWVYHRSGDIIPLAASGPYALRDGITFAANPKSFRVGAAVPADVYDLMKDIVAHYEELRTTGDVFALIAAEFQRRPLTVIKLYLIKAGRSWYGTDSQRLETPILLMQIPYLALILWSSWLALRRPGILRTLAIALWAVTGYFWAMNILSTTLVRYQVPVVGLLLSLAGMVAARWKPGFLAGRWVEEEAGGGQ